MGDLTVRGPDGHPVEIRRVKGGTGYQFVTPPPVPPERRCVWPECAKEQLHYLPLCPRHMDEAYTIARELYESSPDMTLRQRNAQAKRDADYERARRKAVQARESKGKQPGWVYYLRVGDQIKIGYTTDILRRMREYPPGSPLLAVHPGTLDLEKQMHERFRGSRARGREWYRAEPHLLAHCEEIVSQFGDPSRYEHYGRDATRTVA